MDDNSILKELDLKSTVITALLLSCDKNLEALGKLSLLGKKSFESMVNLFFEINMIHKANEEGSATRVLLKNVRKLHLTSLIIKQAQKLQEFEEIFIKIGKQTEGLEQNAESLNEIFGNVSEKFKLKNKGELRSLSVAQLTKKAELLLLITNIMGDIVPGLSKDFRLKNTILEEVKKFSIVLLEDRVMSEEETDGLKYYLQMWIYRPYVNEEICKEFSEKCLELIQVKEGFV